MSYELTPTYHAEDLFCASQEAQETLEHTVEAFAEAGPDSLVAIFDFDKNMTTNGPKDLTSWDAATPFMPVEARREEEEENRHFIAIEERRAPNKHGKLEGLTDEETWEWYENTLRRYTRYGISIHDMAEYGGQNISLRPHVANLFKLFEKADVPTVIVSAGLAAVIERVAELNDIKPGLIVSTDPNTDEAGRITSWDRTRVVHNHNKWQRSQEAVAGILAVRKHVILTGDSFEDPKMVEEATESGLTVLRIRVGDSYKIPAAKASEFFEQSFEVGYDAVSVNGMQPVYRIGHHVVRTAIDAAA